MTKLFHKDKPLIGLDISQTGIKIMSIDPVKWLVLGYGSIDLNPTEMQKSFNDPDEPYLSDNLRTLMKQSVVGSLASNHVAIGLPTSKTYIRTFNLPTSEEKHIADSVEIEVGQYIPQPISTLYVDYEILERDKKNGLTTVSIAAVPSSLVNSCMKAAQDIGLTPLTALPGIEAIARVIEATEEGHLCSLIVDIGPASTDIAILDKSSIRVTGGVGVGGNTFTLDISKVLDITLENAHQLKVLNGLGAGPKQAKISKALNPSLGKITNEIKKVIRYYNERLNNNRKIEQILIVGGGANVVGIGEYFTNELIMPARVASPWQKLDFGSLQEPNKQFRPRYITVAGLASIKTNEVWQ